MKTTLDFLYQKYGPLMSLDALATIFDRSREGLRVSLTSKSEFADAINGAKRKCGRRLYFRSTDIAKIIDEGDY